MKKILSLLALSCLSMGAWAFEVSDAPSDGNWAANTHWYLIQNKKGGYVSSNYLNSGNLLLNNSTLPHIVYGMWCFVGDDSNGYKLYNRAKGTNFTLQWNGDKSGSEGGAARFKMVESATENNTFDISDSQKSGFKCVKMHGSTNDYWNLRDNFLSFWCNNSSTNDDGSAFEFKAINDFEADAEATYTLQLAGTSVYLNAKAATDASKASIQTASEGFRITGTKGAYTLEGLNNNSKIGHNHAWDVTNTTETWDIVSIENTEGYYIFRGDNGQMLGPNSGVTAANSPVYTNHTRNIAWNIVEDARSFTDITYVLNNAFDEEINVVVSNVAIGEMAPQPEIDYFTFDSFTDDNCQVSNENKTFHVTGTWSFPFQEGKFYQIKNRNQQYLKNVDASNISTKNPANNNAADMLWFFQHVANTQNQYTIHSVSTETAWNGTSGKMALAEEGTSFQILKNDSYFNIFNGNPNGFVGAHQSYDGYVGEAQANGAVGYWNGGTATEPGSQWSVLEFDESTLAFEDALYLGTIKATPSIETAFDAYNTNKTAENLKTALEAYAGAEKITLSTSKYYRLANYDTTRSGGNWVGSTTEADATGAILSTGRKAQSNVTDGGVAALWQFEESDGAYYLKNVNSGTCIFNSTTNNEEVELPINKSEAGTFTIDNVSGKWWRIKTKTANEWLHQSNHGDRKLLLWSGVPSLSGSQASLWSIEEMESIPVTVGTVGYTTVNFPVAVTIPAEVKAYKVTAENETTMTLAEVTGDVPAGTALIIEASADTYNFAIATSGTAADGNLLQGTTIRRTGFAANSFYALAADDTADLGVSFKSNGESVTAVPANKAYLPVSAGSSNKALYFDFGGITTGIDAVEAQPAADALYNINGQRVVAPTRGIYVKANGQKVFIK